MQKFFFCNGEFYSENKGDKRGLVPLNPIFFKGLSQNWALYPDHVVFLGVAPHIYGTYAEILELSKSKEGLPELLFIEGEGVYCLPSFNLGKLAQLRCYKDVIARQIPDSHLTTLSGKQISELLNWDAEQYRIHMAK